MNITILSGTIVGSHELEVLKYFSRKENIIVNYYPSLNIDSKYYSNFLSSNINILLWKDGLNFSEINILFDYIIPDELIESSDLSKYRFIYIGNFIHSNGINTKIKSIETYSFFKSFHSISDISRKFPNAITNNIYNINYPSGIKGFIDAKPKYFDKFIYDLVITLGGGIDFNIIDRIIEDLPNKKILIIGKNHPHKDIINNKSLLLMWENKNNVSLINMVNEEKLYILLKLSKIGVLPFGVNVSNDITRISDLLFIGKTIITSRIDANKNLEFLNYSENENDFIEKINYFLEENRYNDKEKFDNVRNYYEKNFNISLILDKIIERLGIN